MQMEMDEADQKPQKHIQKQVVTNFTNAVATRLQGPSTFTSGCGLCCSEVFAVGGRATGRKV